MNEPQHIFARSFKIFWVLLKISAFILLALWLTRFESDVYIKALDYEVSMTLGFAIALLLIIVSISWLLLGLIKGLLGVGGFWKACRRSKNIKKAAESFDRAVNSYLSEDYHAAFQDFSRAMKCNPPRQDLYRVFVAMSALRAHNKEEARDHFFKLTQTRAFAFAGYYGLYHLCEESPISLLEQGRHRTQDNPWVLKHLFDAYKEDSHNLEALQKGQKLIPLLYEKKILTKEERKKVFAEIVWQQALYYQKHKDFAKAIELARESYENNPGLPGPVIMLSEKESPARAQKMLAKAFKAAPHPDLTETILKRFPQTTEAFHAWEDALGEAQDPESLYLLASLAYHIQLWGRAKQIFQHIPEDLVDLRIYTLKERLLAH